MHLISLVVIYTIKLKMNSKKISIEKENNTKTSTAITMEGVLKRSIEQMQGEIYDLMYQVSSSVTGEVSTGPRSHESKFTTHCIIIGGENEQAQYHRNSK